MKTFLLIASTLAVAALSHNCATVTTQTGFDLEDYVSAPWFVQQQAVTRYLPEDSFYCVRAKYEQLQAPTWFWRYTVSVTNEARKGGIDGNIQGGGLCAYQKDSNDPAKLAVAPCWLGPKEWFAGDYWVLAYNATRGYALISGGQPTVDTGNGCRTGEGINEAGLWIFTREQERDEDIVNEVRGIALDQGFDLSVLKNVTQQGCVYNDDNRLLEEVQLRGNM